MTYRAAHTESYNDKNTPKDFTPQQPTTQFATAEKRTVLSAPLSEGLDESDKQPNLLDVCLEESTLFGRLNVTLSWPFDFHVPGAENKRPPDAVLSVVGPTGIVWSERKRREPWRRRVLSRRTDRAIGSADSPCSSGTNRRGTSRAHAGCPPKALVRFRCGRCHNALH